MLKNKIAETVQARYGLLAGSGLSGAQAGVREVAQAFGYTPEELAAIPAEANMGVSCGNPTALAGLKSGEVVVDLGCGGGMDVFLAAAKVGPTGKVIGIDMTPEMIELARRNAARNGSPANVEFHLATIDELPLPDASVDCVISNCVINLAPDKPAVFAEAIRVLKPGGRLAASDIALKKPLPTGWADNLLAYVGCIAGAILIEDYQRYLLEAGFKHVQIVDSDADLNAYAKVNTSCCCAPSKEEGRPPATVSCCGGTQPKANQTSSLHEGLANLLQDHDVNEYAASVKVYALKAPTRDGKPDQRS